MIEWVLVIQKHPKNQIKFEHCGILSLLNNNKWYKILKVESDNRNQQTQTQTQRGKIKKTWIVVSIYGVVCGVIAIATATVVTVVTCFYFIYYNTFQSKHQQSNAALVDNLWTGLTSSYTLCQLMSLLNNCSFSLEIRPAAISRFDILYETYTIVWSVSGVKFMYGQATSVSQKVCLFCFLFLDFVCSFNSRFRRRRRLQ